MTDPGLPSRARNPFGIAAMALAIVVVVVMLASRTATLLGPLLIARAHLTLAGLQTLVSGLGGLGIALAVAASVTGIIGITRPALPHRLAAVGLGVGATAAVVSLLDLLAVSAVVATAYPR